MPLVISILTLHQASCQEHVGGRRSTVHMDNDQ